MGHAGGKFFDRVRRRVQCDSLARLGPCNSGSGLHYTCKFALASLTPIAASRLSCAGQSRAGRIVRKRIPAPSIRNRNARAQRLSTSPTRRSYDLCLSSPQRRGHIGSGHVCLDRPAAPPRRAAGRLRDARFAHTHMPPPSPPPKFSILQQAASAFAAPWSPARAATTCWAAPQACS